MKPEHLARTMERLLNRLARDVLHSPTKPPPGPGLIPTVVVPD